MIFQVNTVKSFHSQKSWRDNPSGLFFISMHALTLQPYSRLVDSLLEPESVVHTHQHSVEKNANDYQSPAFVYLIRTLF